LRSVKRSTADERDVSVIGRDGTSAIAVPRGLGVQFHPQSSRTHLRLYAIVRFAKLVRSTWTVSKVSLVIRCSNEKLGIPPAIEIDFCSLLQQRLFKIIMGFLVSTKARVYHMRAPEVGSR
jgi:hypothetical protein